MGWFHATSDGDLGLCGVVCGAVSECVWAVEYPKCIWEMVLVRPVQGLLDEVADAVCTPCVLCCMQVTDDLAAQVHDTYILKEITGSDHVPLGIVIMKQAA